MICVGKSGAQYNLSTMLKSGGEGEIYDISGKPNLVAKIYKAGKATSEKEQKLIKMANNPPGMNMLTQIAWPQDVLYGNAKFVGFVMPKLKINEDLNVIYEYGSSAKYQRMPWENRIIIAENLCIVLEAIHYLGHVCGDLNPKNISVDPNTGFVVFLDTDSYHIQDGSKTYRCDVGIPEYLPVEVQRKMRGGLTLATANPSPFSKETDNFALAIHIFQLLMNGVHPFACALVPGQSSVVAPQPNDNIERGMFPFMQNTPGIKIPAYAPEIGILPRNIQDLFRKAFIKGHNTPGERPKPQEWRSALSGLRKNLKNCSSVSYHQYIAGIKACPWCKADKAYNDFMNRAAYNPPKQTPIKPPPIRRPPSPPPVSRPSPSSKLKRRQKIRIVMSVIFALSCIPLVIILDSYTPPDTFFTVLGLVLMFLPLFMIRRKIASIIMLIALCIVSLNYYGFSFIIFVIGILYLTSYILARKYFLSPYKLTPVKDNLLIIAGLGAIVMYIGVYNGWFSDLGFLQSSFTQITQQAAAQPTSLTISSDVTSISEDQYANRRLTSVTFNSPSSLTAIGTGAFRDNQLSSINIPSSVREIGMNAFANNPVTSVTIGANVILRFSGNIGILGQNTGFNGAYANNNSRAGSYTRPNTNTTEWSYNGQPIRPQTTQQQSTLVGTYYYSSTLYITFSGSNFILGYPNGNDSGTYRVSGNSVIFSLVILDSDTWTIVDSNTLRDPENELWIKR